jgi:hypothetical protein
MDRIGKRPKATTVDEVLGVILQIAQDERSHVLCEDALAWERLKMKELERWTKKIMRLRKAEAIP